MELEQQLVLAKQRYKEINEELDELRSQIADQTMQTDDYRKKVLGSYVTIFFILILCCLNFVNDIC